MLQAKQEEETMRFREQMEVEAKAQRDQKDNTMKASMKQGEEDRRAFIQRRPAALSQQLKMKKVDEKELRT